MKKVAMLLILLSIPSFAAMTDKMPAEKLKSLCDVWVDTQGAPIRAADLTPEAVNEASRKLEASDRCQAFINGMSNEMIGELSWLDETHKHIAVGNWDDGVTVKQEILIFTDYVNQNPAMLNKPATTVFRKSVEAAGIYLYTTP
jgi:hypothetical protein